MITPRLRVRALIALGAVLAVTATLAATGDASSADTAPSNTAAPTVSGTTQQGSTLSTTSGSWAGTTPMSFTYAWERCDSSGSACTTIGGATAATYTLASADVAHTIRSQVTASNSAGSASQESSATHVITGATPPSNTKLPAISGSTVVGANVSASNGNWNGTSPITYAYQWRRCDSSGSNCSNVGSNSADYTVASGDNDHRLRVIVTATNAAGSGQATSDASNVVTAGAPINTAEPKITGSTVVGQTLSLSVGTWSSATTISYAYQWLRCDSKGNNCASIGGATASTYKLGSSDSGSTIRGKVTAKNSAGSSTVTANAVGPITTPAPTTTTGTTCTIAAANVSASNRLTVASVKYSPSISHGRAPVSATYKVIDQNKCVVSDALVYVVGLPYNWMAKVPEARTGANGQVTLTLRPTRAAPLRGALVMFVRARTPQGNLLAGSSTRRLVQLLLRP